jgi:ubiquinone/menaquinone biosynthesis C-methylase UbiE
MNKEEYQKLYDFEDFYWWHVGRRDIIKSLLSDISLKKNSQILDAGCGCGGNLEMLSQLGSVVGLDKSPEAIKFCKKKGFNGCVLGNVENIDFPAESFDLVSGLDILEHVDDEKRALKEFYRVLKKGGHILLTVPSYQFLWSEHDEALGHKRRYVLSDLSDLVERTDFDIIRKSYFITFAFPLIFTFRFLKKLFPKRKKKKTSYIILPSLLNSSLIYLLKLEAFLSRYINFPFGVSIVLMAKKPKNDKNI